MIKFIGYSTILVNIILGMWIFSQHQAQKNQQLEHNIPPEKRLVLLSELNAPDSDGTDDSDANTPDSQLPEIELVADQTQSTDSDPWPENNDTVEAVQPKPEEPEPIIAQCYTVGPFFNSSDANRLGKRMQDQSLDISRREKTEQLVDGYRVYIPPLPSKQEATVVARELSDLGILDYFIINDDEQRNGISLGLFKQKSGAIRRMAQIRRFNFNVTMQARQRETTVYWLDVTDKQQQFSQQLWRELSEADKQLQRLSKKC